MLKPKLTLKLKGSTSSPQPGKEVVTLAKDARFDELYVNFETTPRMCRLLEKKCTDAGRPAVKLLCWAEFQRDWIPVMVREDYKLGTDTARLHKDTMFIPREREEAPPSEKQIAARAKFAEAAKERRAEQPKLPPAKPDGKRCFFGMIGEHKVLLDAGNGEVLGRFAPAKFDAEKEAKKLKRTLCSRTEATPQASTALQKAWAEARAKLKGGK